MRIVSFLVNHEERIGIEIEEGFLDLNLACRGACCTGRARIR